MDGYARPDEERCLGTGRADHHRDAHGSWGRIRYERMTSEVGTIENRPIGELCVGGSDLLIGGQDVHSRLSEDFIYRFRGEARRFDKRAPPAAAASFSASLRPGPL